MPEAEGPASRWDTHPSPYISVSEYNSCMNNTDFSTLFGQYTTIFVLLAILSLVWKGMALWKAGRMNQVGWFIVLLLINTAGILDILYLYVFSPKKKD